MIDRRFELLKDEVKQSSMWEVNNPRVIKIVTLTMRMIEDDDLFNEEQKEQLFFILRAIIKVWGNNETNV